MWKHQPQMEACVLSVNMKPCITHFCSYVMTSCLSVCAPWLRAERGGDASGPQGGGAKAAGARAAEAAGGAGATAEEEGAHRLHQINL